MNNKWINIFIIVSCGMLLGINISEIEAGLYVGLLAPVVVILLAWGIYRFYTRVERKIRPQEYKIVVSAFFLTPAILSFLIPYSENVQRIRSVFLFSHSVPALYFR